MPSSRTKSNAPAGLRAGSVNALRESEARFRILAECAPVVVWMTDADGRCIFLSGYWGQFTGRNPEADLGSRWLEALHPDDRERAERKLIAGVSTGNACTDEYRVRRADGTYGWLYNHGVPYFYSDGSYAGHIGTCIDVTEKKNHEEARAKARNDLVLGLEMERARISRELHDDISQRLALACVALDAITGALPTESPDSSGELATIKQQLQTIAADIHRISHNLHPSSVDLGLTIALRRLCRDFSEQKHIAVDFLATAVSSKVPRDVALALFRVTQECLSNVAKHSGSQQAAVSLTQQSGDLLLRVEDHGVGFDYTRAKAVAGLGLLSIEERARMIGAHVEITSAISRGTAVSVRVPIHPRQHR